MIIPKFWAEGRIQNRQNGRQVTVRRFGWSNTSLEDAQMMADERARIDLQRILSGEKLQRRELKTAYGGSDGMPIREEVIATYGDTIITRNSYGALCLNTPKVLFVDVDLDSRPRFSLGCGLSALVLGASIIYALQKSSFMAFAMCATVLYLGLNLILGGMNRIYLKKEGDPSTLMLRRIRQFAEANPDWHLRVYETPAGFRVLVMHAVFDSDSLEVKHCFEELNADPVYVLMCKNQRCFRARVSPKPWRIGINQHLRPRPGVWPVNPEKLPERQRWVKDYEEKAAEFASCRLIESLGSGQIHPDAEAVRHLHDALSRAESGSPIA